MKAGERVGSQTVGTGRLLDFFERWGWELYYRDNYRDNIKGDTFHFGVVTGVG